MKTTRTYNSLLMAALLLAVGCASDGVKGPVGDDDPVGPVTQPPATSGNEDTTFDHMNEGDVDPWELLARMEEEGPPEFSSRLHSCPKMKYATLGRVLQSLGVDLANGSMTSAGFIYSNSDQALGVANYGARQPEATDLTTASAAKLFDVWVAAAPEIIANMPSRVECQVGGVGASMFNAAGECTTDGVSCLIGMPATLTHVQLCNVILSQASTPELGKTIAVAALAAAAHTCE